MPVELDELKESLERLGETAQSIPFSMLYPLSDLAGERWVMFLSAWATYVTDQRRQVVLAMLELAEANVEVNFDTIFRHCLEDPDDEVRAMAIDGLWENEDVALIGPLLTMLRADPSVRVRAAAASGLGRFVLAGELEELEEPIEARIMTELLTAIHLAEESVEVRRRAIESVAYACTPEVLDVLEVAYHDEDETVRISAVTGMGRSCDKRWGDLLLRELGSESPAMRYEAAWACGELALHRAVSPLARLINDPDRQVCNAAIWALGQIGGSQAKEILLIAYDDADDDERVAIGDALAELALAEGDLNFAFYDLVDDGADLPDEELFVLWAADEDTEDPHDEWDVDDL